MGDQGAGIDMSIRFGAKQIGLPDSEPVATHEPAVVSTALS